MFKISTNRVLTSLYLFTGGNDSNDADNGLMQGSDGNFHGTTIYGSTTFAGTVFTISSSGALTSLYSFTGGKDGGNPEAALLQGSDGSFYGSTTGGGDFLDGTIFRIVMPAPPAPPVLNLAQNGIQLVLSWPTNAAGFVLEAADSVSSATTWSTNSDTPIIIGDQNTITVSNPAGSKFYRLQK